MMISLIFLFFLGRQPNIFLLTVLMIQLAFGRVDEFLATVSNYVFSSSTKVAKMRGSSIRKEDKRKRFSNIRTPESNTSSLIKTSRVAKYKHLQLKLHQSNPCIPFRFSTYIYIMSIKSEKVLDNSKQPVQYQQQ